MNEKIHDEKIVADSDKSMPDTAVEKTVGTDAPHRGPVRRMLRWSAFGLAGLLGLVTVSAGGGLLFLRSDMGERWMTSSINSALSSLPSGLSVQISAFKGPLLGEAHLEGIVLKDKKGEWLTAKSANLSIDWSALPSSFVISELSVEHPRLLRVPEMNTVSAPEPEEQAEHSATPEQMLVRLDDFIKNWPGYLPELRLEELAIRSAEVCKEASPLPFIATAKASASAGREGLRAKLSIQREDGTSGNDARNRSATVEAALVPDLRFKLDARLSDLGFASVFMPPQLAASPAVAFSLSGDAPIADWHASVSGNLRDDAVKGDASANVIAALKGSLGLKPLEEAPTAMSSLVLQSGPLGRRALALAGQKDGRVELSADASVSGGQTASARTRLELRMDDMQWGSSAMDALLGRTFIAGASGAVTMDASGSLRAVLDKFHARASHLEADASGKLMLDGKDVLSPESHADIKASVVLNDAAALSSDYAGDMKATAMLSGPFSALKTELSLTGSRLETASLKLRDLDVFLSVPSADVAQINDILTGVTSAKAKGTLMDGSLRAALSANEQPFGLDTKWQIKEAGKSGLGISFDRLDMHAGTNSVTGTFAATLPKLSGPLAKGTVASLAGMPLPSLDGRLGVDVSDWALFKTFAGLPLSGSPLKAELLMENTGKQFLKLEAKLSQLQMARADDKIELKDFGLDVDVADLWGKPAAAFSVGLNGLKAGDAVLRETSLRGKGGLDSLQLELASSGGVESSVQAQWKPGSVLIEEMQAMLYPAELGFRKDEPVGIKLTSPISLSYSADSVRLPSFSADFLPAGHLEAEGGFSKKTMKGSLSLTGLDLAAYRQFSQALPKGIIEMEADFSGSPQAPSGKLTLNLKEMLIPGSRLDAIDAGLVCDLGIKGKRRMLDAKLDLPEKTLKALDIESFSARAAVPFTSPSSGASMPDMRAPFKAVLALDGEVAGLWKLVPAADMRLAGHLKLDSSVVGTLSSPVVSAHATMEKGRFLDILNGVALHDIQLKLDADSFDVINKKSADKVKFSLAARGGSKGTLDVSGWLDPSDMSLDIDGTMKDLAPLRRQDAKVMLSGSLGVEGTAGSPLVTADITVDKGEIELARLPGSSIPHLEIWSPEEEKVQDEPSGVPGRLDVTVRIPNQFFVRGYGLDCEWGGKLRIDAPLTAPAVNGNLKAVRGSLDILGKNFKLARGEIRFDGGWPISPLIDIDMEYVAANLTADILVSGTASNPKLELTSQPAYPQDEIISQIMFGQSSGSLSHVQAIQLASGAAALAGFGGADVIGLGRKMLGVDVFRVNSDNDGESSDVSNTSLEVGTYVRDNIYVGMEQGIGREADTGAVVEIELLPSLEVQAKAGSRDTEVGLEWKKNY